MLELGVDEFTVVCRPTALHSNFVRDNWPHVAQNIIQKLSDRGDLETVLGPIRTELKCLKGYTHGYTFGEHSFYIGQKPLFGHHSGKQSRTFWACYMKLEALKDEKG